MCTRQQLYDSFVNDKFIRGYTNEHIVNPIEGDKDSYSLSIWYKIEIATGITQITCHLVRNWVSSTRAETLLRGTIAECKAECERIIKALEDSPQALTA